MLLYIMFFSLLVVARVQSLRAYSGKCFVSVNARIVVMLMEINDGAVAALATLNTHNRIYVYRRNV